ncbi:hypothetical protein BGZ95_005876 [Linnemannia exigua]|uniref:Rubisco LSMT substrate-binding domain-containing protein n=1 Tax=Linnemannia exigua TaxID=604196 RepID=A0AAD4DGC7_9FUNG|nr:hypothetical protein BGZ95_005876 [Linnemannia exigua]
MASAATIHSSKQSRFVDWLTANNASFPKLEFRDDADGCGSVYASADIAEDEVFLTIPFEPLVITDALARKHLPSSAKELDSRTVIMLFLIQQTNYSQLSDNGANEDEKTTTDSSSTTTTTTPSFYKPYLDMIPDQIYTALSFDEQDMERLRGTNAYLTVKELQETLRMQYNKTMEVVGSDLKVEDGYTWERFLWAKTVISSRTFPASLFGNETQGEIVLIPLADSLNHKSRHKITWIKTAEGLQMTSAAIKKGDQVFNNYGPKSNEELLTGYGFCIENNADDLVTLKTNFSRDPDQERKSEILKYLGIKGDTVHYLKRNVIPDLLLATMRVMAMNPTEVTRYHSMIEDCDLDGQESEDDVAREQRLKDTSLVIGAALSRELQFVGLRNEYAMLDLMDMLLRTKLQGVVEWDQNLSTPENSVQEFVKIYRQGQKEILESCAELCRGMFSILLKESSSAQLSVEQAVFGSLVQGHGSSVQRRLEPSEFYNSERFMEAALEETRSMSELKREAVQQVVLNAEGIMIEHKDNLFGEAFTTAFPDHEHFSRFITAAKNIDYSSQLDEDMRNDVEDLRQSLQETLEEIDPEKFDFTNTFTPEAFLWATGLLEALSLSLHIDGELVSGILAPRDPQAVDGGRLKRKLEQ